jgi:hypothetical protein
MERIIVTVKRANEARVRDVELAADLPIEQIAEALAQKFGWDRDSNGRQVSYRIEAHPPGRDLDPGETLAQADTWDGAWLVLHPNGVKPPKPADASATSSPAAPASVSTTGSSPLLGFTPLGNVPGANQAAAAPPDDNAAPPIAGYTWKRVDPD